MRTKCFHRRRHGHIHQDIVARKQPFPDGSSGGWIYWRFLALNIGVGVGFHHDSKATIAAYIACDAASGGRRRRASIQQSLRSSFEIRGRCVRNCSGADEEKIEAARTVICQKSKEHL